MPKKKKKGAQKHSENAKAATRATNGQFSREDPRTPALAARARRVGQDGSKREVRLAMTGTWHESDAGLCINSLAEKDRDELYDVWKRFTSAEHTYKRRILGISSFPKTAKIEMQPERFESDQSHSIDIRTDEERDIDAKRRQLQWRGYIGKLPLHYQSILFQAEVEQIEIWANCGPTARGYTFISALRALAEAVEER